MKKTITPLLCAFLLGTSLAAQAQTAPSETAEVQKTINNFFEGMRRSDSTMIRRTLAPAVVFHSIGGKPGQTPTLQIENINGFLKAVGTPHANVYDERITFDKVLIDANLASVWTPYEFYVGDTFSHCGYNSFQLVKLADGWKIAHIIDTRRKEKCK
jgi:hypothetical protein